LYCIVPAALSQSDFIADVKVQTAEKDYGVPDTRIRISGPILIVLLTPYRVGVSLGYEQDLGAGLCFASILYTELQPWVSTPSRRTSKSSSLINRAAVGQLSALGG
jgi:hypothetical protein